MKKNVYDFKSDLGRLTPDPATGLTREQVDTRIAQGLTNEVKNKASKSYFRIFFDNICTFFNLFCLICFGVMLTVPATLSDYSFIVIYVLNMAIGIIQEIRAKKTVEKLSLVKAPTAKVVRDGKKLSIPVGDVVLDDIIELSLGDQIPADCILLSGGVEVDESMLTGESVAVKKAEGDVLFSGSFISGGSCLARADKVGQNSYVQTLSAKAKKYKRTRSELLDAMNKIIKTVGLLIIPIAVVTAFVNYGVYSETLSGTALRTEVVRKTVAVVIGMIPSGMFLLTTLSLAVGIIKLATLNTSVQDMYSLEMLARVNVLCLDKTGTITDGNMSVSDVVNLDKSCDVNLLIASMERSLCDKNMTADALNRKFSTESPLKPTKVLPFSSKRKLSAVTFSDGTTYALGAPDFVCKHLTPEISEKIKSFMECGKRVLMLAKTGKITEGDELVGEAVPLALIALEDNIRPEAIETIKWFRENDVAVKVISGDDPLTVSRIAARAGIENAQNYVSLAGLTDEEVAAAANNYSVFGRVSPEQKALLIKTIKSAGNTVAMTGDGVNDILAMKEADCSITVASGSAAARSLSHLVLLDDNFNSLPSVVKEGRRVINNIQRSASLYLMKTMFTLCYAIISAIRWQKYPFSTGNMIMLEFFIIGLPSTLLSVQPNSDRVKGNFISFVFAHAIPGTIILVLNVLLSEYAYIFGVNLSGGVSESVLMLALTFGGWVFLVLLCVPYDLYRGAIVGFVTTMLIVWAFFLMDCFFFKMTALTFKDNLDAIIFLFVLIALDFPVLLGSKFFLSKLFKTGMN